MWLYLIAGATNITSFLLNLQEAEQISKATLMPLLIGYVYIKADGVVTLPRLLLSGALICSWLGDVLLIYGTRSEWYFLGGLGMFLIAQIIYCAVFNKATYEKLRFNAARLIPVFILAFVMATRIIPFTGKMMIPVIAYAICLFTMLGYAKLREGLTSKESYLLVLAGGLAFVVSDSLIAFNKFVMEIPYASAWVMGTYIPAQLLIVRGIMIHRQAGH